MFRATGVLEPLALLIQGHHGGLLDAQPLIEKRNTHRANATELTAVLQRYDGLDLPTKPIPTLPPWSYTSKPTFEFFLRMLFSALVDADHADTANHWSHEPLGDEAASPNLRTLWDQFETHQAAFAESVAARPGAESLVNQVRREVYDACLDAAELPPGLFRLTVPTGGGKTRSALAFALKHAAANKMDRVITAVPYLTITDQTAAVYRGIFPDDRVILEHHSAAGNPKDDEDGNEDPQEAWRRLAVQDWDAPLIVTTMVQFLESLLGRRTTVCRKLHRIANSVVILDEAQTIPAHLRGSIFDVLRELVTNYRTTVVLCTATQPALDTIDAVIAPTEIAPDPPQLFKALERVHYEFPGGDDEPWTWERVAEEMRTKEQSICVVNTIAQARDLFAVLGADDGHFHLSTRMCGAHRRDILTEVRRRLNAGEPCRLVSTQLIEAGVDLDFPLLLRALGPLDRIVQAAGRCNREGRMDGLGRVVVFVPAEGSMPKGAYRAGANETSIMLKELDGGTLELNDPATFDTYFRRLYASLLPDRDGIQAERSKFNYETVDRLFSLIDDDAVSVLVRYRGSGIRGTVDHGPIVDELLANIGRATGKADPAWLRKLLRRAQPYLVNVRRTELPTYVAEGLATDITEGVYRWDGAYDERRGLTHNRLDVTSLVL